MNFEIVDKKIQIDERRKATIKLINDHFENAKSYNTPKAQLIIADLPYNLGNSAYASNPVWYKGGGTIRMARVSWLVKVSSIQMRTLK